MTAHRKADYRRELGIAASAEAVFEAIATLDGVRGWWTPLVTGSDQSNGSMRLKFEGLDEYIDLRVAAVEPPLLVEWSVVEHSSLDEWAGTSIRFALRRAGDGRCVLDFRHEGLSPKLECFEDCKAGWDHFLPSLASFAENGRGAPFRGTKSVRSSRRAE